jgi:hypothetical protein
MPNADDLPPGFAGWLEEHPDGGFILVHADGLSPALQSYDAVTDYLDSDGRAVIQVVRVRHVFSSADEVQDAMRQPKLYPPEWP